MSGDALYITSSVAVGTAIFYLMYQSYSLTKRQQHLMVQNAVLTDKLIRLENDVATLKEISSHLDSEEVFLDTSEYLEISAVPSLETDQDEKLPQSDEEVPRTELDRLDKLIDRGGVENFRICYENLSLLADKYPKSCEIQWKLARSGYLFGAEEMDSDASGISGSQKILMKKCENAAKEACEIDPLSGDAHKWMAIIIGTSSEFMPVQEQLKSAYIIKEHIDLAIKYKPEDALSHHILGRWCFSVSRLSWVERKLASAIYAEPPTATIDDALKCFLKVEDLEPKGSIENALYLAKCYSIIKEYSTCAKWLKTGSLIKASTRDVRIARILDQKALIEIKELLSKYSSYLKD